MSSMVALNDIASRTLAYTKKLLPWTPREGPPAHEQMLLKLMRSSALSDVDAAVKIVERGCFEGTAETSYEDLAKFYALASAYGSAYAMNCLAYMSKHGIGVKQDDQGAVALMRTAVDLGNTDAKNALALMYMQGRGLQRDDEKAVELMKLAAEEGSVSALYNLGYFFDDISKDYEYAVHYYKAAASHGDADAMNNLGVLYYEGRGVPKDSNEATYLWALAIREGSERALGNVLEKYGTMRIETEPHGGVIATLH